MTDAAAMASATLRFEDPPMGAGARILYADLDLAERDALHRRLGTERGVRASDRTALLAAYERWGDAFASHLGGAFAVAIWDPARRAVILARDPVGIAPLVFARTRGGWVVGGRVRSVLAHPGVDDALDADLVAAVLLDSRVFPGLWGRTFFPAIDPAPPGHVVVLDETGQRATRYWRPEDAPDVRLRRPSDYAEAFRALLADVVSDLLPAAGSVGVHVSGGLDSSSLAALTADALAGAGRPSPTAFAWLAPPAPEPTEEHRRIEAAATAAGAPLVYAPTEPADVLAHVGPDATRAPYTSTLIHERAVQRRAAALGITTIVSGWGGDEAATASMEPLVRAWLLRTGRWGGAFGEAARLRKLRPLVRAATRAVRSRPPRPLSDEEQYPDLVAPWRALFHPEALERAARVSREAHPFASDPQGHIRTRLAYGHLGERTAGWGLVGAEAGIRYRYPLLDRRVLTFVLGLPPELWLVRDGRTRWLIRAAMRDRLPPLVLRHPLKRDPVRIAGMRQAIGVARSDVAERLAATPLDATRAALVDPAAMVRALARSAGPPLLDGLLLHAAAHLGDL